MTDKQSSRLKITHTAKEQPGLWTGKFLQKWNFVVDLEIIISLSDFIVLYIIICISSELYLEATIFFIFLLYTYSIIILSPNFSTLHHLYFVLQYDPQV